MPQMHFGPYAIDKWGQMIVFKRQSDVLAIRIMEQRKSSEGGV